MTRKSWALFLLILLLSLCSCRPVEPENPARPMQLLRPLTKVELEDLPQHGVPCCSDGFICYGNPGTTPAAMDTLLSRGPVWQYFNLLHVQPQVFTTWRGPWWETLAAYLPQWNALLVSSQGDTAYFFEASQAYGGYNYLVDWARIDSTRALVLLEAIEQTTPGMGVFLDQNWRELRFWMFSELKGARLLDFTLDHRKAWSDNYQWFVRELRKRKPVLVNGEWPQLPVPEDPGLWTIPPPVYLEHAYNSPLATWPSALGIWQAHPGNVLSVTSHEHARVDSAIARWKLYGGWLAFTGYDIPRAYQLADQNR